jgi:hypothetical protein
LLSVSIENWSKIFKEISQGDISVSVSELPNAIQQVVHSEFGDIDSLSYGTWLEIFARLDTDKTGVLDISGFSKFAAKKKNKSEGGETVQVESGVKSLGHLTKDDKDYMEKRLEEGASKKDVRKEIAEKRKERKDKKKEKSKETRESKKDLIDEEAQEAAKVKEDDEDDPTKGGSDKFGSIINFVITELFEKISGDRTVDSPFRKGMDVTYTTVLNNYTPKKLDAQEEGLKKAQEDAIKKKEDLETEEEKKKYQKYVSRAENQFKAFTDGRPKAEAHLKKVLRARQRFYTKMKDNDRVKAIAERYAQNYVAKGSAEAKRNREALKREQTGRTDTKFLKRLIKAEMDGKDISDMKPTFKEEEGSKKTASVSLTHAHAQALVDLYSFKVRLAKLRGEPTQQHLNALTLAKAAKRLMRKRARDEDTMTEALVARNSNYGDAGSEFSYSVGSRPSTLKETSQRVVRIITQRAENAGNDAMEAVREWKKGMEDFGLKNNRGDWEYDEDFWEKQSNGDYDIREDRLNEDGTVNRNWNKPQEEETQEEEEETQEDEKPSSGSSYKQLMQRFTQIYLDAVFEKFKESTKFDHPFTKQKRKKTTVDFLTLANYKSDKYWEKELKKAQERHDALIAQDKKVRKDLKTIEGEYKLKQEKGKEAYQDALKQLGKAREQKARDSKFVYELAQQKMDLKGQEKNDRGWTCAGLVAGIQNKYGGETDKKANDINKELNLNLEPKKKDGDKDKGESGGGDAPESTPKSTPKSTGGKSTKRKRKGKSKSNSNS